MEPRPKTETKTKTTENATETKTEAKTFCETKTRKHKTETETKTGLVYSNVCKNEINRHTDIFAITVTYGYKSQRTANAEVSVIELLNFYEDE